VHHCKEKGKDKIVTEDRMVDVEMTEFESREGLVREEIRQ
jgi:hypothetical protein